MKQATKQPKVLGKRATADAARFIDWLVIQGVSREVAAPAVNEFACRLAGKAPSNPSPVRGTLTEPYNTYVLAYQERYHEPPLMLDQDWAALKRLLKQVHGNVKELCHRIEVFVSWNDNFVVQSGHKLTMMIGQWNRLTAHLASMSRSAATTPADCRHTPRCLSALEHSRKFLQDMSR